MNFLTWNCRGTAARGFVPLIKDIKREYDASLMFLLETHSTEKAAKKQVKKMGFSGSHIVESNGQAGGIWCLWDANSWNVEVLESSDQYVHLKVYWKNQMPWWITVVYANPYYMRRNQLWDDLVRLADSTNDSWVVLGDFNATLTDNERKGGASDPANRGRQSFRNMIHECELIDAGFQRSPYTWRRGTLFQRLDRMLINMQWRARFAQAAVFHLPYFKSDHRVVLMQMERKKK